MLDQLASGQLQPEVTFNSITKALQAAKVYGLHDSATSGLTLGGYGGTVPIAGVPTVIADWTLNLTASSTCYVRKQDSTGIVSFVVGAGSPLSGPTDWPAPNGGYTALYTVPTLASTIDTDNIIDHRVGIAAPASSGAPSGAAGGDLTGTYPNPTIDTNAVANTQLAQMAAHTFKGNNTGSTANALDLTISQMAAELGSSIKPTESIIIACSDETTALTTGGGKVVFRMPYAFTVSAVRASLTTAQASGSIFTVDINDSGTTILSTKLTIDNTEKTSTTANAAAVISDASLADDAEISIDIDSLGDGTAKGLKVVLIGTRT